MTPRTRVLSQGGLKDSFGVDVNDSHLDSFILAVAASTRGEPARLRKYKEVFEGVQTTYKDKQYAEMVRSGVPCSQRRNLWLEASGALFRSYAEPELYERLCEHAADATRSRVTHEQADAIRKDAYRAGHSSHVDMSAMHGSVRRVLLAHEQMFPGSYTQGMNLIVLAFLLVDFEESECFWMLERLSQHYFPFSFHETVVGQYADFSVLEYYVRAKCPVLMSMLKQANVSLGVLTPRLIGSLGLSAMPYQACFQLWDRMFCIDPSEFFSGMVKILHSVSRELQNRLAIVAPNDFQSEFVKGFWDVLGSQYDVREALVRKLGGVPIKRETLNYRRVRARQSEMLKAGRETLGSLAIEHPIAYAERVDRITHQSTQTPSSGGSFDLPHARSNAKRLNSARLTALKMRSADTAIASIQSGKATVSIAALQNPSPDQLAKRESAPHPVAQNGGGGVDETPSVARRALLGRSFSLSSPSLARYIAEENIDLGCDAPSKQATTSSSDSSSGDISTT